MRQSQAQTTKTALSSQRLQRQQLQKGVGVDAAMKIALSYKMGDITLSAASDNEGAADSTNSVGVSYTMNAITVSYTAAGDKGADLGDDYDLKLSYSAGALTASF